MSEIAIVQEVSNFHWIKAESYSRYYDAKRFISPDLCFKEINKDTPSFLMRIIRKMKKNPGELNICTHWFGLEIFPCQPMARKKHNAYLNRQFEYQEFLLFLCLLPRRLRNP